MCKSKQHKFHIQRKCKTWVKKERDMRIILTQRVGEPVTKKKSIYGGLYVLQERYPFVAALDAQIVCKAHYDACAYFTATKIA